MSDTLRDPVGWRRVRKIYELIPDLASPDKAQESLWEILADPTIARFWSDRERACYVDSDDRPADAGTRTVARFPPGGAALPVPP